MSGFKDSIDLILGNYQVASNEGIDLEKCPIANENKKYLIVNLIFFE